MTLHNGDMTNTILIVDDDPVQRRLLQAAMEKIGYDTMLADDGETALRLLQDNEQPIKAIILDLVMPGMDGLEVLRRIPSTGHSLPVIVQTSKGSIDTAVQAMRAGAFDFIVKPVAPARLGQSIAGALKVASVESRKKKAAAPTGIGFAELPTNSPSMRRVIQLGQKAAASDIPVPIEGESGVGKELIARAIQSASERRSKPFVTVNCGAIPDTLVESILFGHEKGAFTGATEKHVGKFVEADNGTLFLDEIGDLPLAAQVKLLRAVQEGEIDPVGGRATAKVNIRLISATNQNLIEKVKEGRFREDLFYRLNVFPVMVPPLRDRREDIGLLVQHFIARFAHEARPHVSGIQREALSLLERYDWPGNIRQLENAVFRAVVLCENGVLSARDFPQISAQVEGIDPEASVTISEPLVPDPEPLPAHGEAASATLSQVDLLDRRGEIRPLVEIEHETIRHALRFYNSQMSEVARKLGIGRSTLYRKLKEMGIEPDRQR